MSEPKFIVDLNAGRLVKWLRIMGYDTTFVPGIEDGRLVSLAHEEGRILVTRDRNIMRRRLIASGKLRAILLESESVEEQLRQVVDDCKLDTQRHFPSVHGVQLNLGKSCQRGNQGSGASLRLSDPGDNSGVPLLPETLLEGHSVAQHTSKTSQVGCFVSRRCYTYGM